MLVMSSPVPPVLDKIENPPVKKPRLAFAAQTEERQRILSEAVDHVLNPRPNQPHDLVGVSKLYGIPYSTLRDNYCKAQGRSRVRSKAVPLRLKASQKSQKRAVDQAESSQVSTSSMAQLSAADSEIIKNEVEIKEESLSNATFNNSSIVNFDSKTLSAIDLFFDTDVSFDDLMMGTVAHLSSTSDDEDEYN